MFVFLLSQERCTYSTVWLGVVFCWFVLCLCSPGPCPPLAFSVCVIFFSAGRGKSERVLLEMTHLFLLGTQSLSLGALEKLLLAQSSPVGNTPLGQRGSFHTGASGLVSVSQKRAKAPGPG